MNEKIALFGAGGKVGPDGPHVIGAQASPGLGFSPDAHGVSDAWQLPPLPVQDVADVGGRHGVDQFKGRDRRTLRSQGKHTPFGGHELPVSVRAWEHRSRSSIRRLPVSRC